jgi:FdhD protein
MPRRPVTSTDVERVTREGREVAIDLVAVEEPLQILLEHGEGHTRRETPLAMTMRTPGHDLDLVTGFLFAEGVISGVDDLIAVRHCARAETPENVVRAVLRESVAVPTRLLERSLPITSACGVCGERTVEALSNAGCQHIPPTPGQYRPNAVRVALRSLEISQAWFRHTGGTHGAALFDRDGEMLLHREDVGRHNALDKLIGASLSGGIPFGSFIVVSSRASFELVQKTVRAGIPMMVAIGAPTSLAIETAKRFGLTLIGFAKESRFNIYSGAERLAHEVGEPTFFEVGAAE